MTAAKATAPNANNAVLKLPRSRRLLFTLSQRGAFTEAEFSTLAPPEQDRIAGCESFKRENFDEGDAGRVVYVNKPHPQRLD
jgi:hypothetical protein